MPAVLSENLHSAFVNEEYAVHLLRQPPAVAPVGRVEDHGIDAVAILLPSANGFHHAADTFLIQFKSKSVNVIAYDGEAVTQLSAAIDELNQVLLLLEKPEKVEA